MDTFDFKYIPKYQSRSYNFQYDLDTSEGRIFAEWSQYEEFISIRNDIAKRIYTMISSNEIDSESSDCHVTADYIAGIGDNFGRAKESCKERFKNMLLADDKGSYTSYHSFSEALENMKFPFICRIMSDTGWAHSLIALGQLTDGTSIGFEQRGYGHEWGFCEIEKSIQAYRGEHVFYKQI